MTCTCCGESCENKIQCDDHDTGYSVCNRCLTEHGRKSFCMVNCKAHGPKEKSDL